MNGELAQYREKLQKRKGRRDEKLASIEDTKHKINLAKRELRNAQDSQTIIQKIAQETQEEIRYEITEPVSLALAAVFENPYKLDLDFVPTGRGNTECRFFFERDGHKVRALEHKTSPNIGGGTIDVASGLPMRAALYTLRKMSGNALRSTFLLDEPLTNLNDPGKRKGLHMKAAKMVKMLSEELGLQIIMVSQIHEMEEVADKVFVVTKDRKGISHIEEKETK